MELSTPEHPSRPETRPNSRIDIVYLLTAAYVLGVLLARHTAAPAWAGAAGFAVCIVAAGALSRRGGTPFAAAMTAAALCASLLACRADDSIYKQGSLLRYLDARRDPRAVEKFIGVVLDAPRETDDFTTLRLNVERVRAGKSFRPLRGVIRVNIDGIPRPAPGPGDRVAVEGHAVAATAKQAAARRRYRELGLAGSISLRRGVGFHRLGRASVSPHVAIARRIRDRADALIENNVPGDSGRALAAMLYGTQRKLPEGLFEDFRRAGVVHVLVVSGFQVALLAAFFLSLSFLWGRRRLITLAVVGSALLIFYAVSGGGPSILRATIMGFVMLAAVSRGAVYNTRRALIVSILAMLALHPGWLFSVSAQLSFAACGGLIFLYPELAMFFRPRNRPYQAFLLSVSAQLPLYPILAYYFNQLSLVSPVSNIVVVPFTAALMPFGVLYVIGGSLWPPFGEFFGPAMGMAVDALIRVVHFFASIPAASLDVASPPTWWIALYFAVLFLLIRALHSGLRDPDPVVNRWILAFCLAGNFLAWSYLLTPTDTSLRITAIDVGEGDAFLIEAPLAAHGHRVFRILIDGGGTLGGGYDPGERIIAPILHKKGVHYLDAVLLTHPDEDHLNGLLWISKHFQTDKFLFTQAILNNNKNDSDKKDFDNSRNKRQVEFFNQLKDNFVNQKTKPFPVSRGEKLQTASGLEINFLGPSKWAVKKSSQDTNSTSAVFQLRYRGRTALFVGDISKREERELLTYYRNSLRSELLKVAHHGSENANSYMFLKTVFPEMAVISVGRFNLYGHPSPRTLQKLEDIRANVFRTDRDGTIQIQMDKGVKNTRVITEAQENEI